MRPLLNLLYRFAPSFHIAINGRFEIDTRCALYVRGPWIGGGTWAAYWSPEEAIFDCPTARRTSPAG